MFALRDEADAVEKTCYNKEKVFCDGSGYFRARKWDVGAKHV